MSSTSTDRYSVDFLQKGSKDILGAYIPVASEEAELFFSAPMPHSGWCQLHPVFKENLAAFVNQYRLTNQATLTGALSQPVKIQSYIYLSDVKDDASFYLFDALKARMGASLAYYSGFDYDDLAIGYEWIVVGVTFRVDADDDAYPTGIDLDGDIDDWENSEAAAQLYENFEKIDLACRFTLAMRNPALA